MAAGGVGAIVGALSGHTTFAMSSPGLRYSRLRYGLSASALQGVINIVPERDVVTSIDGQMGTPVLASVRLVCSGTAGGCVSYCCRPLLQGSFKPSRARNALVGSATPLPSQPWS